MHSNLHQHFQARIALRRFDRLALRTALILVSIAAIGIGFLTVAALSVIL